MFVIGYWVRLEGGSWQGCYGCQVCHTVRRMFGRIAMEQRRTLRMLSVVYMVHWLKLKLLISRRWTA